jgi:hypothetical protein
VLGFSKARNQKGLKTASGQPQSSSMEHFREVRNDGVWFVLKDTSGNVIVLDSSWSVS